MQYLDSTEAGEILAHGDEEATANQYVMENDDEKVEAEENKRDEEDDDYINSSQPSSDLASSQESRSNESDEEDEAVFTDGSDDSEGTPMPDHDLYPWEEPSSSQQE